MNEWGTGNEYDFVAFVWHVLLTLLALAVLVFTLAGCAKPVWPDIGGGVRVKEIRIKSCNQLEDECGTKV